MRGLCHPRVYIGLWIWRFLLAKTKPQKVECRRETFHLIFGGKSPPDLEGGDPIALQFQHQINIDLHCVALQCIFCIIPSTQYTLLGMLKPCNTIFNVMKAMCPLCRQVYITLFCLSVAPPGTGLMELWSNLSQYDNRTHTTGSGKMYTKINVHRNMIIVHTLQGVKNLSNKKGSKMKMRHQLEVGGDKVIGCDVGRRSVILLSFCHFVVFLSFPLEVAGAGDKVIGCDVGERSVTNPPHLSSRVLQPPPQHHSQSIFYCTAPKNALFIAHSQSVF